MRKIYFYIIEWKDIYLVFRKYYDLLKFIVSRPKYKIGNIVYYWDIYYQINSIKRDWEHCTWIYDIGNDLNLTEGIIEFYKNKETLKKRKV